MKRILCYGDSNTWGYDPAGNKRFDENERWTRLLAKELGEGYSVIEEGLNGRTTVFDDQLVPYRNGRDMIVPLFWSHKPLDCVVIMLGTNDLKPKFAPDAASVAAGVETLVGLLLDPATLEGGERPRILVVSPIEVGGKIESSMFNEMFGGRAAISLSRELPALIARVAERNGCDFLDAATVTPPSDFDSIHLDVSGHAKLAHAIALKLRSIIG
jgi:lysophospholipase L1-like esterase